VTRRTNVEAPILAAALKDIEEPSVATPRTETADPRREKLRKAMEEPS